MSEHPTSSGQTAEHGIDTAAIRANWASMPMTANGIINALCDALDRLREQNLATDHDAFAALEAENARLQAEVASLTKCLSPNERLLRHRLDDARARLDEIRALCDDERPGYTAATLNAELRAILDREDRA